ncbi:acyl-CoA N-acyltransferase [Trichoderma velutinum]
MKKKKKLIGSHFNRFRFLTLLYTLPLPNTMADSPEIILKLSKSVIRRYRTSDATAIVESGDTPLVSEYMSASFPSPYTLERATGWIKIANEEGSLHFAICSIDNDVVIGACGFDHLTGVESRTKVLGYWLSPKYWGQGIMTEVISSMNDWIFGQVPTLLRLEAIVVEENRGSIKVLEKAGYQQEGIKQMSVFKNGRVSNTLLFGLTRNQWNKSV